MARMFSVLILLPTIFAAPQELKKDDAGRHGLGHYPYGPVGSAGIHPIAVNPVDVGASYGKRPRPTSPCDQKRCRVSSPCCEPEPEVEKITVPVQPIVANTVVGYEYAEVSRPVEVPKCDRTACGASRPCCGERVAASQPIVSSFVVPVSNSNYNPASYNSYPYPAYYGGYGGHSNFYGGYPYVGGLSGVTRPNPNVNGHTPLVVEPDVKARAVMKNNF